MNFEFDSILRVSYRPDGSLTAAYFAPSTIYLCSVIGELNHFPAARVEDVVAKNNRPLRLGVLSLLLSIRHTDDILASPLTTNLLPVHQYCSRHIQQLCQEEETHA